MMVGSVLPSPVTAEIVRRGRSIRYESIPDDVRMLARQCLLDWIGVTVAGSHERLSEVLRAVAQEEGGVPRATVIGTREKTSLLQAALINGTAAHALDYDDVSPPMSGHPSAPVLGALLPAAEQLDVTGRELVTAFVAGVETAFRVGRLMRPGHYGAGWHATGTIGTFGAAAAVAAIRGLGPEEWATALGLAGTQAAGLKSMFGTMAKPFHAGKAAENGLLAATLAGRGFTADLEVLDSRNGFAHTQTRTRDPGLALSLGADDYDLRTVLFKFHASCYATHSPIEGALRLVTRRGLIADDIDAVVLEVPVVITETADIRSPRNGSEAKFSVRFATALALAGRPTDETGFSRENLDDPGVQALRERIEVRPASDLTAPFCARVIVRTRAGEELRASVDVSLPTPREELDAQGHRLRAKFEGLVSPFLDRGAPRRIAEMVEGIEHLAVRDLVELVRESACVD